ncbi:MAG TPA: HAD family phosphatase [Anaerolineae bacterium]
MPIRAIIFDVGGVFARTENVNGRRKWEQRLGLAEDTLAMTVWTSEISRQGEIGQATLEEIWRGIGQLFELNAAEVKELQADFWSGGTWDDGLTEFVRSLKPRYKTGVISNAWPEAREFVESHTGSATFDAILFSAEEGVAKPNRVIFERALARLGVAPDEAIFINDVAENIEAACTIGLHGIQFDNTPHVIDQIKRYLNGYAEIP